MLSITFDYTCAQISDCFLGRLFTLALLILQQQENQQRISKGDAPLPDEDINKIFKPIPTPARLDSLLLAGQIDNYCHQIQEFASQSFGKLFMADSLQSKAKES